ncbi:MAG TPA: patatin, partial [Psychrobacter sp.]|nr:patatin [Psychrobacter sp.]
IDNRAITISSLSDFWGFLETNIVSPTNRSPSISRERDRADIVITPNVGRNSSIDTRQRRTLIEAGAQATTPQINAIKQLIREKSSSKYATL